ncbi:MAG: multidrug efflux SMR transporter [Cypionkella sp.]|nr:multidrug efflux SMR transporter [Cypionkella sp.]
MAGINAWVLIAVAGVLECVWALGLKYSDGFSKFWPSVITALAAIGSFWLASVAMKTLPVGTAYAVWVGIGVVGAAVFGAVLLNEPINLMRFAGIALILAGILALKLA